MNMPKSKRQQMTGRGAIDKTAIVGAKDRETNQIMATVAHSTDATTLQGFVDGVTETTAKVYTNDAAAYVSMKRDHQSVNHSVGEYARE